ncbi:MAG: GWxTD domain-containing protein [Rubricoccaceae bacterium]
MRSPLLTLVAALALTAAAAQAQGTAPAITLDTGSFLYTDEASLLEVYLSFSAATLPFAASDEGLRADLPVRLRLRPAASAAPRGAQRAPLVDQALPFRFTLPAGSVPPEGQVFTEQVRLAVPPGEYELELVAEAADGRPEVRLVTDVAVPAYAARGRVAISSVQVASRIAPAEDPSDPMVKSGLFIRPNPDAFYGEGLPRVPFYAEVYHTDGQPEPQYTLLAFVSETNQPAPIAATQTRTVRRAAPVDVVTGSFDVSALPSGVYHVWLVALGPDNTALAQQSRRIYVVNPGVARPQATFAEDDYEVLLYAAMAGEELALNVEHALVLANSRETQQAATLATDEERRAFLVAFWRARNAGSAVPGNAARQQFYERLAVVNQRYREAGRPGFATDRGRVVLRYGFPTDIQRRPNDTETAPHEVWTYDNIRGEGRAQFVFADRFSSGQFEQIFSSVAGERSLPDWERELRRRR